MSGASSSLRPAPPRAMLGKRCRPTGSARSLDRPDVPRQSNYPWLPITAVRSAVTRSELPPGLQREHGCGPASVPSSSPENPAQLDECDTPRLVHGPPRGHPGPKSNLQTLQRQCSRLRALSRLVWLPSSSLLKTLRAVYSKAILSKLAGRLLTRQFYVQLMRDPPLRPRTSQPTWAS